MEGTNQWNERLGLLIGYQEVTNNISYQTNMSQPPICYIDPIHPPSPKCHHSSIRFINPCQFTCEQSPDCTSHPIPFKLCPHKLSSPPLPSPSARAAHSPSAAHTERLYSQQLSHHHANPLAGAESSPPRQPSRHFCSRHASRARTPRGLNRIWRASDARCCRGPANRLRA